MYTLGDLDAIYTEQQDSSLLLNIEPQQILEQVMTESHEVRPAPYVPPEPQPSVSNAIMTIDSDDSKDFISEPQGLLIDNDVDVDVVGMDLDLDLTSQLDLNLPDTHQDLEYDSE